MTLCLALAEAQGYRRGRGRPARKRRAITRGRTTTSACSISSFRLRPGTGFGQRTGFRRASCRGQASARLAEADGGGLVLGGLSLVGGDLSLGALSLFVVAWLSLLKKLWWLGWRPLASWRPFAWRPLGSPDSRLALCAIQPRYERCATSFTSEVVYMGLPSLNNVYMQS